MLKLDRALSEKNIPHGPEFAYKVAHGAQLYRGALTALCKDGSIVPAGATNTPSSLIAIIGVASRANDGEEDVVLVKKGCYALPFDKAPGWDAIGQDVYALDDETVTLNSGAAPSDDPNKPNQPTRLKVGILAGIENGFAYVLIS